MKQCSRQNTTVIMFSDTHVRVAVLSVVSAIRIAVLIILAVAGALDLTYFTYINYFVTTLVYLIGISALYEPKLMCLYSRFIFPIAFSNTLLVAFLIVIIIFLDSAILMSHAIGGTLTMGQIYAAVRMLFILITPHIV